MFIYTLTKQNEIRYWNTGNFNEIPGYDEKLIFVVHDIEEHEMNCIKDIYFPNQVEMEYVRTHNDDYFGIENSILISDKTKEIKPLKIGNIWKFIEAGNWENYDKQKNNKNMN